MLGLRMCEAKNSTQAWHASSPRRAIGAGTRVELAIPAVAGVDAAIRRPEPPVDSGPRGNCGREFRLISVQSKAAVPRPQ